MENSKKLVVFYSYTGHTKMIAEMIQKKLNCDILEIKPVEPYSTDYQTVVDEEQRPESINHLREIEKTNIDLSKYTEIIVGFPTWWYIPASPIRTFLKTNDLSNKIIKPFATNAGWLGRSFEEIVKLCPNSKVDSGLNIVFTENYQENKLVTSIEEINKWIETL